MSRSLPGPPQGAQSIERAVKVLRAVAASGSLGTKSVEIVALTGLTKGTVHRILLALIREGLVEQADDTRLYFLGPEAYVLGTIASPRYGVDRWAPPALRRLADVSQDTAFFSILRGFDVVTLQREEGAYPIKTHVLKPGDRHPLGVSSAGQAILAAMDDQSVMRILKANAEVIKQRYPRYSIRTIEQIVEDARKNGFALNPGLVWPGSWGIGIAVVDPEGKPIGALNISAIESRLGAAVQKELAVHLRREAKWLSDELRKLHSPRSTRARINSGRS
jgi:DNA-binding IclR family transcriptional regulator